LAFIPYGGLRKVEKFVPVQDTASGLCWRGQFIRLQK